MDAGTLTAVAVAARIALQLHHHVRGPRIGYAGLILAAAASWSGLPGPGEAALVAAGVLAAHGRLDLVSVVTAAWIGATVGGTAGWGAGRIAGRRLISARGPLLRARLAAVRRADRLYERYGALAVFLTPSWAAGTAGMRAWRFIPANALSALVWALGIGAGAYLVGPPVLDVAHDAGTVGLVALGVLLTGGLALELRRRRRR